MSITCISHSEFQKQLIIRISLEGFVNLFPLRQRRNFIDFVTLAASDGTRLEAMAFRSVGTDLGELLLSERQMPVHVAGPTRASDRSHLPAISSVYHGDSTVIKVPDT